MNVGKTLFAQVMEYVPWKTFGRIVERHQGDAGVRTLSCADLFRVMVFAQLTWRESLRDIEACLAANRNKLFHMGIKAPPARSTLSDALNQRNWRIYHGLAQRLCDVCIRRQQTVPAASFATSASGSTALFRPESTRNTCDASVCHECEKA